MLEMADTLAENAHEYWAKKKSQQFDALGQYRPYGWLTVGYCSQYCRC